MSKNCFWYVIRLLFEIFPWNFNFNVKRFFFVSHNQNIKCGRDNLAMLLFCVYFDLVTDYFSSSNSREWNNNNKTNNNNTYIRLFCYFFYFWTWNCSWVKVFKWYYLDKLELSVLSFFSFWPYIEKPHEFHCENSIAHVKLPGRAGLSFRSNTLWNM